MKLSSLLDGSLPIPAMPSRGTRPTGTQSVDALEVAPLAEAPASQAVAQTAKQRARAYARDNGFDGLAFTALVLLTMHADSGEVADLQQAQESLDMLLTLETA